MVAERRGGWVLAPGLSAAVPWSTWVGRRTVLFIAQHPQSATRLAYDLLPHLEDHGQIDVVWTTPDEEYRLWDFDGFMRKLGTTSVPWWQAEQTPYDLIVTACYGGLADTIGHKIKLPHGINAARSRKGPFDGEVHHDLTRAKLMKGDEVVPSALMLSHENELDVLAESCPPAVPRAVVAGCLSFDRMLVSRHLRRKYRRALRVRLGQKLVVVSTTWSPHSLWGTDFTFFERLRAALPSSRHRIVAVVHPFVWLQHAGTVRSLVRKAREIGIGVLPYDEGWRAALIAADLVIGDHGSVTQYAAALGIPVLMNAKSLDNVRENSTADALAQRATLLRPGDSLLTKVREAMKAGPALDFGDLAVSNHGQALDTVLNTCYSLLEVDSPEIPARVQELPMPVLLD
ncbi:hypothetical protein [Lentzea kentuckyensis]|uniref:hypothetical protein n=1 Tax=Lentzea kentuckyensis TaxID=360086 RepID=UPI000A3ACEB6|nr:hypothetical protein [Lentzea kentuckyensis]